MDNSAWLHHRALPPLKGTAPRTRKQVPGAGTELCAHMQVLQTGKLHCMHAVQQRGQMSTHACKQAGWGDIKHLRAFD
eukprot:1158341-Pelagomonas_calceolata.AAC.5